MTDFSPLHTTHWTPFPSIQGSRIPAFTKRSIPYIPHPNRLQTLDLHFPATAFTCSTSSASGDAATTPAEPIPAPSAFPHLHDTKGKYWIVFIHGGGWRDPAQTAAQADPLIATLLSEERCVEKIAGVASLNYSLSPYPSHATDPSPPNDGSKSDKSRMARHPRHVLDVCDAVGYLQERFGFGERYVVVGHSCGATLGCQLWYVEQLLGNGGLASELQPGVGFVEPRIVVGCNGLYDLSRPSPQPFGKEYEELVKIYESFVGEAFGEDRKTWDAVSPVNNVDGISRQGKLLVLADSDGDSLMSPTQADGMQKAAQGRGLEVQRKKLKGDHHDSWMRGLQMANVVQEVLRELR